MSTEISMFNGSNIGRTGIIYIFITCKVPEIKENPKLEFQFIVMSVDYNQKKLASSRVLSRDNVVFFFQNMLE